MSLGPKAENAVQQTDNILLCKKLERANMW